MFRKARQIHFVGIGGSGMSGIAEVLVNLGYHVSGSDLQASDATRRLKRLGAKIFRGHKADHVAAADVVVVSSAVKPENPEIVEARRRKIPVDSPRRDAGRDHAHEVRRRRRRGARQDLDDRDDRGRPHGGRARPDRRHRRARQGASGPARSSAGASSWSPRRTSPTARSSR
mgnify:CR=1 FL=1